MLSDLCFHHTGIDLQFPKQGVQAQGKHLPTSRHTLRRGIRHWHKCPLSDLYWVTSVPPGPGMAFWKHQPLGQWKGPFVPNTTVLLQQRSAGAQGRHRADALDCCLVAWALGIARCSCCYAILHILNTLEICACIYPAAQHANSETGWELNRAVVKSERKVASFPSSQKSAPNVFSPLTRVISLQTKPEATLMARATTTTEASSSQHFQKQHSSSSFSQTTSFWGEKLLIPSPSITVTRCHLTAQHQGLVSGLGGMFTCFGITSHILKPNMC